MPDEDLDELEPEDGPNPNEVKKLERLLAKAEKQQAELEARAQASERKLVVAEAGLKLSPVQMAALSAVHEGEWTPESLATTATELGFGPRREESQESEPDLSAYQRLNQAAQGGQEAPKEDILAMINAAQTESEVLDIMEQKLGRTTTRTNQ